MIDRAAELMEGGEGDAADDLRRLLLDLEQKQDRIDLLTRETETRLQEAEHFRQDMLNRIEVSKTYLSRLEGRMTSIFDTLQSDESRNAYELVGDSLDELRISKKKVASEQELLSRKGLKRVSESYKFYEGETVVILCDSEWKGYDALVRSVDEDQHRIYVKPVLDIFSRDDDEPLEPMSLHRRDVAVYDYPGWDYEDDTYAPSPRKESKVLSVLGRLNVETTSRATVKSIGSKPAYKSSRQRKAASKKRKKKR